MDRQTKEAMVASLSEVFRSSQVGFLVDFRGLTVAQATELRRRLREAKTQMRVIKNNLARIALKGTPFEPLASALVDTRALVFGQDPIGPAQVITRFIKENEKFKYVSGFLVKGASGRLVNEAMAKSLAELPSREQLIAQLLGLLQAPAAQFLRLLNEVPAKFLRTLTAVGEAKGAAPA